MPKYIFSKLSIAEINILLQTSKVSVDQAEITEIPWVISSIAV